MRVLCGTGVVTLPQIHSSEAVGAVGRGLLAQLSAAASLLPVRLFISVPFLENSFPGRSELQRERDETGARDLGDHIG